VLIFPRPRAYSTAQQAPLGDERFGELVTATLTLKEALRRLAAGSPVSGSTSVALSREQPMQTLKGRIDPSRVTLLDRCEQGGFLLAKVSMDSGAGHGRFQWYRTNAIEGEEDSPDRLVVLGDIPPGNSLPCNFGFGPDHAIRIAASASDSKVEPVENTFTIELEALPSFDELEAAPIEDKVILTAKDPVAQREGRITAPGEGRQDYQLFDIYA
ncbi:MAG: hypothetical protein ACKVHP_18005, partial [Verrucomicrobiales bacterium]